ncbi:hypothetical protein [Komagataeibacter oboediens]|uniref:hypothetical protein n=1 Tax=Komagataeibacter oboediens TaxID=65958 RepID=UPI000237DB9C|nr:hypothetical protein [Komagataeibacter oboediens]
MQHLSRFAFACASVMLMLLALLLLTFGMVNLLSALGHSWHAGRNAILQAISYVVIAVAVFDVAKYFVEENISALF